MFFFVTMLHHVQHPDPRFQLKPNKDSAKVEETRKRKDSIRFKIKI